MRHSRVRDAQESREPCQVDSAANRGLSARWMNEGSIMLHEFSLVLASDQLTDADCDCLYEAGLDDGTISTSRGVSRIDISREADSMESAIRSAIGQINTAGLVVARVEIAADQFAA